MLSYLVRQSAFFYPVSVATLFVAAAYFAVTGRWAMIAGVIILAVGNWFQHLFVKGWIRTGEDNDAREWLRQHPDYVPEDEDSVPD
ncbi:hypothetical protein [Aeromicrobium chenweiae]|uniref:Uncharacterized protein n=1 Tax=Aeromicrobium chenweiae TaxID=2079793 RepID=A0A2S0WKU7_9ACTN|nr:hypothetical protein [Aeromicrobium chenweiae]AWB91860.1 hypothetical protein C3E78_06400 [Aeromicrobium chenweiae]TGN32707.1 hypothetical protein E4L97_08370 [Aeromicrobium chenweiae]